MNPAEQAPQAITPEEHAANILHKFEEVDRALNGERPLITDMPWIIAGATSDEQIMLLAHYNNGRGNRAAFMAMGTLQDKNIRVLTEEGLLIYDGEEWDAFVEGVKDNEFNVDDLSPEEQEAAITKGQARRKLLSSMPIVGEGRLELPQDKARRVIAEAKARAIGATGAKDVQSPAA